MSEVLCTFGATLGSLPVPGAEPRLPRLGVMSSIDDRLHELRDRRSKLPGSVAVMETKAEAEFVNSDLCTLEDMTMRLGACWDGELDPIGAYSQLAYLHEQAEQAAWRIREAVERLTRWTESD